ncbi:MAG: regulator of chromosome condensation 1/beta-lactamase-inhibitor protein II [Podila humilis]|nr:MAG: regulator of chromosome condensation 1/beta-lactamase-inhibitor protein II [Podila humilis]
MRALYFGFNVRPTPMDAPCSETNQNNEEQVPDPHHVASLNRVSHEKDSQGNIADSMAPVLFAGWASFVLAKEKARIHGDFSPEENLIVNSLNNLSHTTSSGTDVSVKLFGWEALQGLLTASGDIIGIEAPLLTRTLFSDARDVAAGGSSCDHYTVVVDTNRQLFYWTASERIPKAFPSSSLDTAIFERVWAGEGHFLALSTNGSLYSWGSGRHGQLGHGNLKSETKPKCIESLEGIRIVDAACGGSFSIALSEFGDVYTFGLNDHGQLGIGDESESNIGSSDRHAGRNNAYPQLVDFYGTNDEHDGTPLDVSVVKVACGQAHAVCLDDQGNAWSCGWGKYGQLEPQESSHRTKPHDVGSLSKQDDRYTFQKIAQKHDSIYYWRNVICGRWSTFLWE